MVKDRRRDRRLLKQRDGSQTLGGGGAESAEVGDVSRGGRDGPVSTQALS